MQLQLLNEILTTLHQAGIQECIIEKTPTGSKVRATEEKEAIFVVSDFFGEMVPASLGVHKISVLLDRLKLFNLDEANVSVSESNGCIKTITIKQGHRRVSFTGANPTTIRAPSSIVNDDILHQVLLTKDGVSLLCNALMSVSGSDLVTLAGEGSEILIKANDGKSDEFVDSLGENKQGEWSFQYRREHLQRLLKMSTKTKEENVTLGIMECGVAVIVVGSLSFFLIPQEE